MDANKSRKNEDLDFLFSAILKLDSIDECYNFFDDLCTIKEANDMAQRLKVAVMLSQGNTYEQIINETDISSATISRINRCLQYGSGGYKTVLDKTKQD